MSFPMVKSLVVFPPFFFGKDTIHPWCESYQLIFGTLHWVSLILLLAPPTDWLTLRGVGCLMLSFAVFAFFMFASLASLRFSGPLTGLALAARSVLLAFFSVRCFLLFSWTWFIQTNSKGYDDCAIAGSLDCVEFEVCALSMQQRSCLNSLSFFIYTVTTCYQHNPTRFHSTPNNMPERRDKSPPVSLTSCFASAWQRNMTKTKNQILRVLQGRFWGPSIKCANVMSHCAILDKEAHAQGHVEVFNKILKHNIPPFPIRQASLLSVGFYDLGFFIQYSHRIAANFPDEMQKFCMLKTRSL